MWLRTPYWQQLRCLGIDGLKSKSCPKARESRSEIVVTACLARSETLFSTRSSRRGLVPMDWACTSRELLCDRTGTILCCQSRVTISSLCSDSRSSPVFCEHKLAFERTPEAATP